MGRDGVHAFRADLRALGFRTLHRFAVLEPNRGPQSVFFLRLRKVSKPLGQVHIRGQGRLSSQKQQDRFPGRSVG